MPTYYTTISVDLRHLDGSAHGGTLKATLGRAVTLANGSTVPAQTYSWAIDGATGTTVSGTISLPSTDSATPASVPMAISFTPTGGTAQTLGSIVPPTTASTVTLASLLAAGAGTYVVINTPVQASGLAVCADLATLQATSAAFGTRVIVQDIGIYRYDPNSTATVDGSSVIAYRTGVGRWHLEIPALGHPVRVFDIRDYGGKVDGVTNDKAAFDAAVAAARAAGGGTVTIPAGTCVLAKANLGTTGAGLTGITLAGAGMGVTTIKWVSGTGWLVQMVDGVRCGIRDLTIDCVGQAAGGALRLFGCQECILERVEVKNAYDSSIAVTGPSSGLGIGSATAKNNVVMNCTTRAQQHFVGTGLAQFLAGDGAQGTRFINCFGLSEGGHADLFDADEAPDTVYVGCRAIGNTSPPTVGGFMAEGSGAATLNVTWIGCHAEAVGSGFYWAEHVLGQMVGCTATNCRDSYGVRVAGLGGILTNCVFDNIGQNNSDQTCGLVIESKATVTGCRWLNTTYDCATIYKAPGTPADDARVTFVGCEFDKKVSIYEDSVAKNISFIGCMFTSTTGILTTDANTVHLTAQGCTFTNKGLSITRIGFALIQGNRFNAVGGWASEAIGTATDRANGAIRDNIFDGYTTAFYNNTASGSALKIGKNNFTSSGVPLADSPAAMPETDRQTFTVPMTLVGGVAQTIPGLTGADRGAYLVTIQGRTNDDACGLYVAAKASNAVNGTVATLTQQPDNGTANNYTITWTGTNKLQVTHTTGKTVDVTVVRISAQN